MFEDFIMQLPMLGLPEYLATSHWPAMLHQIAAIVFFSVFVGSLVMVCFGFFEGGKELVVSLFSKSFWVAIPTSFIGIFLGGYLAVVLFITGIWWGITMLCHVMLVDTE